jgi:GNAT superfamily N-acetyltransferase
MANSSTRPAPLTISKFDKARHRRGKFSCGHAPIDNFLKSSLSDQIKAGLVVAYMATEANAPDVLGYYTLGAMAVRADHGDGYWNPSRTPDIPVIYLRAVAVHCDRQGQGLGTALLIDAMQRCVDLSDDVGAAAIVLDVLRDDGFDRRWAFYRRLGFRSLGDPGIPERVFIPMRDVKVSLAG